MLWRLRASVSLQNFGQKKAWYKMLKTFSINELILKDIYTFHSFAKRGGDELPINCIYFNETMTYARTEN